ncbi:hypothetical protein [Spongiactinospora rosea]|uniref:hypothetical protein n=1 Tax=Spongiactinospora rosea TaxID=2248750 RepID=UPI001314737F|nr:hypothetical protein [Spongiactinospora rosea]
MLIAVGLAAVLLIGVVAVGAFGLLSDPGQGTAAPTASDDTDTASDPGKERESESRPEGTAKVDLTAFKGEHICSALTPATLDKLVPEGEENPSDANFGDQKDAKCEWKSGEQAGKTERNRTLTVALTSFTGPQDNAERKLARERENAELRAKSGSDAGYAYDELKDLPGIGEAAFGTTYRSPEPDRLMTGADLTFRVPGGVVIVEYRGFDRAAGLYGKRSAISPQTVMDGAQTVAKEIIAALEKKPGDAGPIGRLTGKIRGQDLCKVVAKQTVDQLTPNASVNAKNWSTSNRAHGTIRSVHCAWASHPDASPGATYRLSRLTIEVNTYEREPGEAFARERKTAQYRATTKNGLSRSGPVREIPGLAEGAFSQVTEVKMGSQHSRGGQVWFLTGDRIVRVEYAGSKTTTSLSTDVTAKPLDEQVVSDAARKVAQSLPAHIAGN